MTNQTYSYFANLATKGRQLMSQSKADDGLIWQYLDRASFPDRRGLYFLKSPSGKIYISKTQNIRMSFNSHIKRLTEGKQRHIDRVLRMHGLAKMQGSFVLIDDADLDDSHNKWISALWESVMVGPVDD